MTDSDNRYDLSALARWRVTYPSECRELGGYLFEPEGDGPVPAVIVNHGSDGLSRGFADVARALNGMGYAVLLPIRRGYNDNPGPHWQSLVTEPMWQEAGGRQLTKALRQENDDVLAALDWLRGQPQTDPDRIGVMGISFGGIMTLFAAARSNNFRAAVSFAAAGMAWQSNPALQSALIEAIYQTATPLFLIQAQNDFSLAPIYTLGGELARLGKVHETRVYAASGTTHLDGHILMTARVDVWYGDVQRFLAQWLGS